MRKMVNGGHEKNLGSAHLFGRLLCENDVSVSSVRRSRGPANRRALRNPFN